MLKFRLYIDKDQETEWLNQMAADGYAMKKFLFGFYTFEECEKGEYSYQIDMGDKFNSVSDDYRNFMEEAGIEVVQTWGFWVILRKKAADGEFVLYSDVDSQIEHYTKIRKMLKVFTIIELLCLFIEIYSAVTLHSIVYWGFVCLIGAIVVAFLRITFHTSDIIYELQERKTGISEGRRKNVSILLTVGLLFNSIALIANDSISEYIRMPIQILAIVLMLAGIYDTCRKRANK